MLSYDVFSRISNAIMFYFDTTSVLRVSVVVFFFRESHFEMEVTNFKLKNSSFEIKCSSFELSCSSFELKVSS